MLPWLDPALTALTWPCLQPEWQHFCHVPLSPWPQSGLWLGSLPSSHSNITLSQSIGSSVRFNWPHVTGESRQFVHTLLRVRVGPHTLIGVHLRTGFICQLTGFIRQRTGFIRQRTGVFGQLNGYMTQRINPVRWRIKPVRWRIKPVRWRIKPARWLMNLMILIVWATVENPWALPCDAGERNPKYLGHHSTIKMQFHCTVCTSKQQSLCRVFVDCRLGLTLSCQVAKKNPNQLLFCKNNKPCNFPSVWAAYARTGSVE